MTTTLLTQISCDQVGFIPKMGTEIHIFRLIEILRANKEAKKISFVGSFDLSKAYDSVNHYILLGKLKKMIP